MFVDKRMRARAAVSDTENAQNYYHSQELTPRLRCSVYLDFLDFFYKFALPLLLLFEQLGEVVGESVLVPLFGLKPL